MSLENNHHHVAMARSSLCIMDLYLFVCKSYEFVSCFSYVRDLRDRDFGRIIHS